MIHPDEKETSMKLERAEKVNSETVTIPTPALRELITQLEAVRSCFCGTKHLPMPRVECAACAVDRLENSLDELLRERDEAREENKEILQKIHEWLHDMNPDWNGYRHITRKRYDSIMEIIKRLNSVDG